MHEPLTIDFRRSAGPGRIELSGTFRDYHLDPDDQRAWMGTEPPRGSRRAGTGGRWATYELTFRRGGERRRVVLSEPDLTAQLRPLVDRLVHLCELR